MKVLSKEEEEEHYKVVVKGGLIGGTLGLGVGLAGVMLASRRYQAFRSLTLPFRSFLVTSSATFGAIVQADRASILFGKEKDPMFGYQDATARAVAEARANETTMQKFVAWGRENRYSIVFTSWLASMGVAFALVNRNKYLSGAQKLVQARVYAQGLAVVMLVVTAAFEMNDAKTGSGRWETVMIIDPEDPEHKHLIEKKIHKEEYEGQDLWKDMVAAEERRIAARKAAEQK
ncbi:mitochondrial hypoxia responsive domain containing protein [Colletotrichum karsti]|uniref:Mitochondrial hypoxia responsive domain containing protein n=1 Tax=Colletotrichum karsti TaxID=1095194 RepID=A0A9P6LK79_9PEZI|nr:mitochondrial hypoxia responsive domain containing protein [Colletotrichum karsti]KAF9875911.1 mitochondrial hypoxia responsive domain containing protein [Colletotrichum karsti]